MNGSKFPKVFLVKSIDYFLYRMNSSHNLTVVNNIVKEIGTDKFTKEQIRGISLK